ncbi:MAG: cysteine biosynthesis protein CysZ, partial [Bradyrhizobiaceae bacterium]|nr:cysteine biosynthesis protein CysZ [Bradyrhizobiaceae bacterium]
MLDAAIKALSQLLSPEFRTVLLKSAGLAIALLAAVFIVLYRLLGWLRDVGISWTEGAIGPISHEPL